MSFEDVYLGMELALLAFMPVAMTIMVYFLNKHAKRFHVWMDLERRSKHAIRKKVKPKGDMLVTKWGVFEIDPTHMTLYKDRPMYRCVEGFPYTIAYERMTIPATIEGKQVIQEWVRPLPTAPSPKRFKNYEDDLAHGQIFGGAAKLQLLLILILLMVGIGIVISIAK